MKRKSLIFSIIACIFGFIAIGLTACDPNEALVESITITDDSPKEFVIGCFDVNQYSFILTYEDGTTKTIQLTEDMISQEDMLKTYRDGTHTLTATYEDVTCEFSVTAKRYEFANIIMEDKEYTYTGEGFSIEVDGALPEGTKIIYPNGNNFIDAGTYDVKATLVNDYYVTKTISAKLRIKPAVYDMSNIKFDSDEFVYDGYSKSISVSGDIPKGLKVTYSIGKAETNSMIEASDTPYVVVAHFDAGSNYEPIPDMRAFLTIKKATYDMTGIDFNDATFKYDGDSHSIEIDGKLPSGVSVSYSYKGKLYDNQANVDEYTVTAAFTGDVTNYEPIPSKVAHMTIEKADMELTSVFMDNATFEYDGKSHYVEYYGQLPLGIAEVRTEYHEITEDGQEIGEVDSMVNVGFYEVRTYFVYTREDKNNYNALKPLTARVEITKVDIDFISFSDKTFAYDGFAHSIFINGDLPTGLEVEYVNNAKVEVGKYTVSASFIFTPGSLAERNYNALSSMNATIKIEKAKVGTSIEDYTYEYSSNPYSLVVTDWVVGGETVGQVITPQEGTTLITSDAAYEALPDGVKVYFTTKVSNVETQFTNVTDPGTVFLNAIYYATSLNSANSFLEHYITSTSSATLKNVVIDGNNVQVYILASKSVLFNVTKKTYVPTFTNEKVEYTGSNITSAIDVTADLANNPSLSFASGYTTTGGIYTNNTKKEQGIYTATVDIKLSENAKKYYYDFSEPYVFKFAIKGQYVDADNDGRTLYDPQIEDDIEVTYDENQAEYKIASPTNVPIGMEINYEYAKELNKPGSTVVKVVVSFNNKKETNISDGELANYYYKLPANYVSSTDGKYTLLVSYTVNKKTYVPTFNYVFEYDTKAKLPEPIDLPSWISVAYEDEEGNPVSLTENAITLPKAEAYHLKAKLTITSQTAKEYYQVDENGVDVDLVINKGYFTGYKVSGEKWKYDGNNHNIIVTGLPDGVIYSTTLGEGVSEVGVYDDVIVYFTFDPQKNAGDLYYPLNNLKLTMTIENTSVELSRLQSYCKTTGIKEVKQFTTLKGILSNYIDLSGLDVEFTCHYYKGNVIYDASYTSRHGTSATANDFIFSESTGNDDVCMCDFTIKLKKGYVFLEDSSIKEFSGSFNVSVSSTIKVSADSFAPISNASTIEVSQLSTLPELIAKYVPIELGNNYTISSWSANYYNGINAYPTSYKEAHVDNTSNKVIFNENDYTFRINTWGERYCLVKYTITTSDEYCFFINGVSYKTYSGTIKCLVTKDIKTVDDTFLKQAISENGQDFATLRNVYFEDYLGTLIDLRYVDINTVVFDNNKDILPVEEATNKHRLEFANATDYENMSANAIFTLKEGYVFKNSQQASYNCTNVNLVYDNDILLNVLQLMSLAIQKSNNHNFEFEQYTQPGGAIVKTGIFNVLFENTEYSYEVTYPDGTIMTGSNSSITSLDKVTEGEEEAQIVWTYKAKDGAYFLENGDTGLRTNVFYLTLYFKVRPTTVIDTTNIKTYAKDVIEVHKYVDVAETISGYINDIKTIAGSNLTVNYEGSYYNGTEKVVTAETVSGNTADISIVLPTATPLENNYYILFVKLSLGTTIGYLFDNYEKDLEFTIKYNVDDLNIFEDTAFKNLLSKGISLPSVKKNTLVQTIINDQIESKYNLNENLIIYGYKIYGEYHDISDPVKLRYLQKGHDSDIIVYVKTAEGTAMLDEDGKVVTEFEIKISINFVLL